MRHATARGAILLGVTLACLKLFPVPWAQEAEPLLTGLPSVRSFGVLPTNAAALNRVNLQKAINWAAQRGAALWVEPTDEPYPMEGGLILRMNVSLIGAHGPVGRGTRHPDKSQPVGSVFRIEDV